MFTGKKKAACAAMLSMAMVAPLAAFAENETRVITCGTLNLRDVAVAMPVKLMSPISQGSAPPKRVAGPNQSPSEHFALSG